MSGLKCVLYHTFKPGFCKVIFSLKNKNYYFCQTFPVL